MGPRRRPRTRPVPADPATVLTRQQAALLANVDLATFDKARASGRLPELPRPPGSRPVRFRWGDVDRAFPAVPAKL